MAARQNEISGRILKGLDELTNALENNEVITEKFTCRRVILNLRPLPYDPKMVKATRRLLRVSQTVFAQFLGVRPASIRSWEQGRQAPSDMACRFLDEIQRNPDYWRKRLSESMSVKRSATT